MRKLRKIMTLTLALVLLVSGTLALHRYREYRSAQQAMEQALLAEKELSEVQEIPLAPLPEMEEAVEKEIAPLSEQAEYLFDIDLAALRAVNPDVVGWISIPGTKIDYPFLQGEDNQHYLNHTWDGARNGVGSVFLECQVSPDFSDFNTIIYGHNVSKHLP